MTETAPMSSADVAIDGAKLREMRHELGYTQRTLAEICEMHQSYLSQLENGRRLHVSPPLFVRLCDALNVPADERLRTLRKPLSKVA